MTETEARKRLVELVTGDILAAGWKVRSVHVSRKKSTYIKCRKGSMRLTVRISDHPPKNQVGCSIHPGGHTRQWLFERLRRPEPPSVRYFNEWLNS